MNAHHKRALLTGTAIGITTISAGDDNDELGLTGGGSGEGGDGGQTTDLPDEGSGSGDSGETGGDQGETGLSSDPPSEDPDEDLAGADA